MLGAHKSTCTLDIISEFFLAFSDLTLDSVLSLLTTAILKNTSDNYNQYSWGQMFNIA